MFTEKMVRNVIKQYVDCGIRKFAIYPFGSNGMLVKFCLEQCFDILPVGIIDNTYMRYNKKISSMIEYQQKIDSDTYIVLTADNRRLNADLYRKLLEEGVPGNRIINLLENEIEEEYKKRKGLTGFDERFAIKNILPGEIKEKISDKIKVRIVHATHTIWNSVASLCETFETDPRFDLLFICTNRGLEDDQKISRQMEQGKHKFVMEMQYDAQIDRPDILLVSGMGGTIRGRQLIGIREYTKLIVAVPSVVQRYAYSVEENWKLHIELKTYQPDYYLLDSLLYYELRNSQIFSDNMIEMGNPKFDEIYKVCKQKYYPEEWEAKLKGKKTILWTTTHGKWIDSSEDMTDHVAFDLYAKPLFEYAAQHTDMGFIFRPHPALIRELLMYQYWNETDLEEIKRYCEESDNIIWDENDTYESAYSVADAVITDVLCGIVVSALPTLKPICVLYRNDKEIVPLHREIVENYYSVHNRRELGEFLDMVRRGEDPMLEQRKKVSKRYVKHFDGCNGERIKEFVMQKYYELA